MKIRKVNLNYRLELSILILLFGTQLSRIIMEWFQIETSVTNIIFLIGIILLPNYINLLQLKFPSISKKIIAIFIYQFVVLIWAFYSDISLMNEYIGTIYMWFSIIVSILITTNNKVIDSRVFVKMGWWMTGIGSFILFYLVTNKFTNFSSTISTLEMGSDRLTLSVIGFAFLIFTLSYTSKSMTEKIVNIPFIIFGVGSIFICSRKGVMVSYIFIFIIHIFRKNKGKSKMKNISKMLACLIILCIVINIFLNSNSEIATNISLYIDNFKNAILGFIGKIDSTNNSGSIRNNNLKSLIYKYMNEYSFSEVLFGRGYAYELVDVPYFQAFTEFGIFMGMYYLIIQLVIPLKLILKKPLNEVHLFAQYYSIVIIMQNVYSGVPYGYYKFIPILFLFYVFNRKSYSTYIEKIDKA